MHLVQHKVTTLEAQNNRLQERVRELEELTKRSTNLLGTVSELKVTNEWEHTEMMKRLRLFETKLEKLAKLERKVDERDEKIEDADDRARGPAKSRGQAHDGNRRYAPKRVQRSAVI